MYAAHAGEPFAGCGRVLVLQEAQGDRLVGDCQLLRRNPKLTARRREVATAGVDQAIAAALGDHDPSELAEVLTALETLGRRLNPQTISRPRDEASS